MKDLQPGGRRDQQHDVGYRVEPGAVPRLTTRPARHAPVEEIGHTGDEKTKPDQAAVAGEGKGPQERDQQQPRGADPVRRRHRTSMCYLRLAAVVGSAR